MSSSQVYRRLSGSMKGADVKALQQAVNARMRACGMSGRTIAEDGEYGPKTLAASLSALYYLGVTRAAAWEPYGSKPKYLSRVAQLYLRGLRRPGKAAAARGDQRVKAYRKGQAQVRLRERAYRIAAQQVGVMESGPNNAGVPFERYEKPNGAPGFEPWCGDFMAYCYRQAGSKAVQRLWASVYFLGRIAGLHKVSSPERGDLVRFTFDHVGMFVRDLGNGYIETIEGNTGASGAVSDSSTGGDGVYRKHRAKGLVQDYLRVER